MSGLLRFLCAYLVNNPNVNGKNMMQTGGVKMDHERKIDIRNTDRTLLKDIRDVVIDTSLPCQERIKSYIDQIGNPYCYVDNGIVVALGYADTQISLQDRLKSYVSGLR